MRKKQMMKLVMVVFLFFVISSIFAQTIQVPRESIIDGGKEEWMNCTQFERYRWTYGFMMATAAFAMYLKQYYGMEFGFDLVIYNTSVSEVQHKVTEYYENGYDDKYYKLMMTVIVEDYKDRSPVQ